MIARWNIFKSFAVYQCMVAQLSSTVKCSDISDFVTIARHYRKQTSHMLPFFSAAWWSYHVDMKFRRRMCTCDTSMKLLFQRCIQSFAEPSSFLHLPNYRNSPLQPIPLPPTVDAKRVSGPSSDSSISLSPLETTSHQIKLDEGGSILTEHIQTSLVKFKSFFDWIDTVDRQSPFQFDLEEDHRAIIRTVTNRFPTCHECTIHYLIKKFFLDMTAWTALYRENAEGFQQMISYSNRTLMARKCRFEKRKQ